MVARPVSRARESRVGSALAAQLADRRKLRAVVVAYAVVVAVVGGLHYQHRSTSPSPILEERLLALKGAVDGLDQGGPPLAAPPDSPAGKYVQRAHTNGKWLALPPADSPGYYVYVPVAAHLAWTKDVQRVSLAFFVFAWSVLLLVVTVVFFELLGVLPGLLAPWLVLWRFDFVIDTDYYWVQGWTLIVSLALLMLVRGRPRPLTLAAALLVASFGDSIRFGPGVAAFLVSCAFVLTRIDDWAGRFRMLAFTLLAYVSISGVLMGALVLYRDATVSTTPSTPRTFWHSAYIGLGYLPNKYGIRYDDGVGLVAARRIDPHVAYLSPAYSRDVRTLFLRIVRHDPGFVVETYWTKLHATVRDGFRRFSAALLLAPLLGLFGPGRRAFRRSAAIATTGVVAGVVSPLLAIPVEKYTLPFEAALGLLWLLSVLTLVRLVVDVVRERMPKVEAPRGWLAASAALVALALAAAYAPLPSRAARALHPSVGARLHRFYIGHSALLSAPAAGTVVTRTDLTAAPPAFRVDAGVAAHTAGGLLQVTTAPKREAYALELAPRLLPAGRYAFVLRGRVDAGGLHIGALDVRAGAWISVSSYSYDQPRMGQRPMLLAFSVTRPTLVRPILANWIPVDVSSRWRLRELAIVRLS